MVTLFENCPTRDECLRGGNGLIHIRDLATKDEMYQHCRMFSLLTVDPGCSIGTHCHEHETEFFYIVRGEAVFHDNDQERIVHPGDVCATGYGQSHSVENRSGEPVEMVALIVLE